MDFILLLTVVSLASLLAMLFVDPNAILDVIPRFPDTPCPESISFALYTPGPLSCCDTDLTPSPTCFP